MNRILRERIGRHRCPKCSRRFTTATTRHRKRGKLTRHYPYCNALLTQERSKRQ